MGIFITWLYACDVRRRWHFCHVVFIFTLWGMVTFNFLHHSGGPSGLITYQIPKVCIALWVGGRRETHFSLTRLPAAKGRRPSMGVHVQIIAPRPELKYRIHPCLSKTRQLKKPNNKFSPKNQDAYQSCYWESFKLNADAHSFIAQVFAGHVSSAWDSEASRVKSFDWLMRGPRANHPVSFEIRDTGKMIWLLFLFFFFLNIVLT